MADDSQKPNGYTLATVYARLDALQANADKRQAELRTEMLSQFQTMMNKFDLSIKDMSYDIKDCRERMIKLEAKPSHTEFQTTFCPNTPSVRNVIGKVDKHRDWHDEEERLREDREFKDSQRVKAAYVSAIIAVAILVGNIIKDLIMG